VGLDGHQPGDDAYQRRPVAEPQLGAQLAAPRLAREEPVEVEPERHHPEPLGRAEPEAEELPPDRLADR
jgi:hypothetical protein